MGIAIMGIAFKITKEPFFDISTALNEWQCQPTSAHSSSILYAQNGDFDIHIPMYVYSSHIQK